MKIQPFYNTNFTGIFRRKQKSNAVKTQNIANQAPKEEAQIIKLGEYNFTEGPDKRKFFASYPHHLQESYIIANNGFTTYEVIKKEKDGSVLQHALFASDNVAVTSTGKGYKESVYFKNGKKEKSIIYDFNGNIKRKTTYSENDDNIIAEIDEYKDGKLSKATTFYSQYQKDVLFVAGIGIVKSSYTQDNKHPRKVLEFDETGDITSETLYYLNGSISERIEYDEDKSKTVTSFSHEGYAKEESKYDSKGKLQSISILNELGNTVTKIEFDKEEKPTVKHINDEQGNPIRMLEYDYEKKTLTTTTYNAQKLIESVDVQEIDATDFEEL